jgi:hypothetical protein
MQIAALRWTADIGKQEETRIDDHASEISSPCTFLLLRLHSAVADRGLRVFTGGTGSGPSSVLFPAALVSSDGRCRRGSGLSGLVYDLESTPNAVDVIVVRAANTQRTFNDAGMNRGPQPAWLNERNLAEVKVCVEK